MTHSGLTLWFTGLSGAGKTTISQIVAEDLKAKGFRVEVLDGDVLRQSLTKDLGFSREDRDENIRRIANLAKTLTEEGAIVLVAVISPYQEAREIARSNIGNFVEVYVKTSLEICEERDVKGLYRRARAGELKAFTGINDPYEEPSRAEIISDTENKTPSQNAEEIIIYINSKVSYLSCAR